MSQRLLISLNENVKNEEDEIFDCIYTQESNLDTLLNDWLVYNDKSKCYVGPWKICIRDYEIWDQFCEDFLKIKNFCPDLRSFDDVWSICDIRNNKKLHISNKEDQKWFGIIQAVINHEDKRG